KTTAWPSPMSITPAFSPGPWITHGALVGRPFRWRREDLYEQCSFHIAEKMPSSVKLGSRPISFRIRSYSSGLSPWLATSSGVIVGSLVFMTRFRKIREGGKGLLRPIFALSRALRGAMRWVGLHIVHGSDLRALVPPLKVFCRERSCPIRIPQPPRPARRHRR